jgi:hypothetical protein
MALAFVAEQLHASPAALRDYGARSQTRTEHLQQIQRYLGFRDATREDFSTSADWLLTRALEHDKPSLLFQLACEQLHAEKIIRLGVTRIERLVMETRERGHRETSSKPSRTMTHWKSWTCFCRICSARRCRPIRKPGCVA